MKANNCSTKKTTHFKNCLGVFQGGGCKAIAFIGSYREAKKRGVHFSEVAGTSAGSIFAALIAAGATPEYLEELVRKTQFNNFNTQPRKEISNRFGIKSHKKKIFLAKHVIKDETFKHAISFLENLGVYSSEKIEEWLDSELRKLLNKNDTVRFKDLKLPLHVVATDLVQQKQKVWNVQTSGDEPVAHAVRCSCTIPFYFQPVNMSYVDGGLVSNLPSFSLNSTEVHFEKILCFTLNSKIQEIKCINSYIESIISSIIDGATKIQSMLQHNTYNISIGELPVATTGFNDITEDLINEVINIGESSASSFFEKEIIKITERLDNATFKPTKDYLLNNVVTENISLHKRVYICFKNTNHMYSLFPTILNWTLGDNVEIVFITNKLSNNDYQPNNYKHEKYRRLLIVEMGINLLEVDVVPFNAFIFKGNDDADDKAIFIYDKADEDYNIGHGAIYSGKKNLFIIKSLILAIEKKDTDYFLSLPHQKRTLNVKKTDVNEHIKKIKRIAQYSKREVTLEGVTVDTKKIKLMTRYVKSYKINQIEKLSETLAKFDADIFSPCSIQLNNIELLVTPIVLERHGEEHIVIKGNSRLCYAHRELPYNEEIFAVVADGVIDQLPSKGNYSINECIITTINKEGDTRYENWSYDNFRKIEECIRNPNEFITNTEGR